MSSSERRLPGVAVAVPFVYGSIAFWLGRKADEFHTHRWNIFVRGVESEDLTYCIKKVVFNLHPSFTNPTRVFEEPPFEVSETGWGEFEVSIRIHFHDPSEQPVDLQHMLKLYPPGTQQPSTKKPVRAELYDELVFHEPTEAFHRRLTTGPVKQLPQHPLQAYYTRFNEDDDLQKLASARKFVDGELSAVKEKLLHVEAESQQLKDEMDVAEE